MQKLRTSPKMILPPGKAAKPVSKESPKKASANYSIGSLTTLKRETLLILKLIPSLSPLPAKDKILVNSNPSTVFSKYKGYKYLSC